ncbi:MAG: hypothetical protein DME76_00660 [Verrucomicrobia bacterium]|nr:MAG: hypothetical protein DME76_00660 [Verrucomicrobiota bacterium]
MSSESPALSESNGSRNRAEFSEGRVCATGFLDFARNDIGFRATLDSTKRSAVANLPDSTFLTSTAYELN